MLKLGVSGYHHARFRLNQLKCDAARSRTFRDNIQAARAGVGVHYEPLYGIFPPFVSYPPDLWLRARFSDGDTFKIHLTEERGYEDIDGMAHLRLYHDFSDKLYSELKRGQGNRELLIVDCACGSGYGSAFLHKELGESVIGIDVDREVVRFAQKRYGGTSKRLKFFAADAASMDMIQTGCANAIISIETIEHVPEPGVVLGEFARILAPGGVLYVSSPDATDRPGTLCSAFHVQEFSDSNFFALLSPHFENVQVKREYGYLIGVCRKASLQA